MVKINTLQSQSDITASNSDGIIFPFSIEIDPMERLLLVNFEKDPDSIYLGFEPQVFNDDINGEGHLIIGWRIDSKIDVYYQKSLNPDPLKYSIAGAGLNEMIPVEMEKAFYEVNDFGVQSQYKFRDLIGREVEISITENNHRKRKPFGLLAPMGDAATHPTALPLVLLHDFYFVRKKDTNIKVSINSRNHQPDVLPIRMDGQKMYFTRYSPKPLIVTINPAHIEELKIFLPKSGQRTFEKDDYIYELEWTDQKASIKSISVKNDIHLITMNFVPAFPCLKTIPENSSIEGNFIISGHVSVGKIKGEYSIKSDKESVRIRVIPSKGWEPNTSKFSTWFLFSFVRVFKKWPGTYQWDAVIHRSSEASWQIKSGWIRTGKILND